MQDYSKIDWSNNEDVVRAWTKNHRKGQSLVAFEREHNPNFNDPTPTDASQPEAQRAPELPPLIKPLQASKHWDQGIEWALAGERTARLEREDQLRAALASLAEKYRQLAQIKNDRMILDGKAQAAEAQLAEKDAQIAAAEERGIRKAALAQCVFCRDQANMIWDGKMYLYDHGDVNPTALKIERQYVPNCGEMEGWVHKGGEGYVSCEAGPIHDAILAR